MESEEEEVDDDEDDAETEMPSLKEFQKTNCVNV